MKNAHTVPPQQPSVVAPPSVQPTTTPSVLARIMCAITQSEDKPEPISEFHYTFEKPRYSRARLEKMHLITLKRDIKVAQLEKKLVAIVQKALPAKVQNRPLHKIWLAEQRAIRRLIPHKVSHSKPLLNNRSHLIFTFDVKRDEITFAEWISLTPEQAKSWVERAKKRSEAAMRDESFDYMEYAAYCISIGVKAMPRSKWESLRKRGTR